MSIRLCIKSASLALLLFAATTRAQTPLGTVFTYQGQLTNAGSPAGGSFNMVFTLWNDSTLSAPANKVGPTLTFDGAGRNPPPVSITNGLFTVPLDFAAGAFDGNKRWLEISVSGTTLTPRQEVTAAPYALRAQSASALDSPDGSPLNAVVVDNDGNVCIGNSNPAERLSVRDRIGVHEGTSGGAEIRFDDGVALPGGLFRLRQSADIFRLEKNTSVAGDFGSLTTILAANNGNVGIGTLTPAAPLHVVSGQSGATPFAESRMVAESNGRCYLSLMAPAIEQRGLIFNSPGFAIHGGIFYSDAAGLDIRTRGNATQVIVTATGNVGIGNLAPQQKLDVNGTIRASAAIQSNGRTELSDSLSLGGGLSVSRPGPLSTTNTSTIAYDGTVLTLYTQLGLSPSPSGIAIDNSGNVNVGAKLQLRQSGQLSAYSASGTAETVQAVGDDGNGGLLKLSKNNGATTVALQASEGNDGGQLALYKSTDLTTPSIILDAEHGGVGGHGRVITQVLEITGGADLSEQFDVRTDGAALHPGMVVCINPDETGSLLISSKAYDRTVAGIMSGAGGVRTGMMMGQKGSLADGKQPIALSGRVYCYADASSHPILPGDLLTTSDVPGHAMKVVNHTRAQGAILGKAMSRLDVGKGLVLVLVTLQ